MDDTRARILAAAEDLLRRHGPEKLTVVDVARALGMSHANVYRHFASKAALREAVAAGWLHAIAAPLEAIIEAPDPAPERLAAWIQALAAAKRRKVREEAEMFAAYHALAEEHGGVVARHVQDLLGQLARIIAAGVAEGRFRAVDPAVTARAVLSATAPWHHPLHVRTQADDATAEAGLAPVLDLLLAGLAPR